MNVVNKGNFFETVKALLLKPIDYDVECLREAIMVSKHREFSNHFSVISSSLGG